jgi:hypothetical protein
VTRAPTRANQDHLSPAFLEAVVRRYAGTRMGRQELDGELIEDRPDALWSRALIESCRVTAAPALSTIMVAIDPPGTSRQGADACGIVAVGRAEGGMYFVLEDASQAGLTPQAWATRAVALYRRLNANSLVAEVNMGGEMVRSVLRQVDGSVPLKEVHARRGGRLAGPARCAGVGDHRDAVGPVLGRAADNAAVRRNATYPGSAPHATSFALDFLEAADREVVAADDTFYLSLWTAAVIDQHHFAFFQRAHGGLLPELGQCGSRQANGDDRCNNTA